MMAVVTVPRFVSVRRLASLCWISVAAVLGAMAVPAEACTLLEPSSAAEAAQWRQQQVDWQAERTVKIADEAEVIFFGTVTAIRPTAMAEQWGGPVRLGWQEVPAFRIWVDAETAVLGELPAKFSVYWGTLGDTCRTWGGFDEGEIALVLARRPYSGGHWFGEVVGGDDLKDLLPALAKRGLELTEAAR